MGLSVDHATCSVCKGRLTRGTTLLTTAFSERHGRRPMCLKCSLWWLSGYTPPYVPAGRGALPPPAPQKQFSPHAW
jgi:hypothetical protein